MLSMHHCTEEVLLAVPVYTVCTTQSSCLNAYMQNSERMQCNPCQRLQGRAEHTRLLVVRGYCDNTSGTLDVGCCSSTRALRTTGAKRNTCVLVCMHKNRQGSIQRKLKVINLQFNRQCIIIALRLYHANSWLQPLHYALFTAF